MLVVEIDQMIFYVSIFFFSYKLFFQISFQLKIELLKIKILFAINHNQINNLLILFLNLIYACAYFFID